MSPTTLALEPEQREVLIGHIVQRLNSLDDRALLRLAEAAREPVTSPGTVADTIEQTVSRRRFMVTMLSGGVLATTAGAVAAWQWGEDVSKTLNDELEARTDELKAMADKLAQVWGLVGLLEQLDEVPIESAALEGLASVSAALGLVYSAAKLVRDGTQAVMADILHRFEVDFSKVRENLNWLEGALTGLAGRLHLLEDVISHTMSEANPITQAVGAFFDMLLQLLPFDMGQRAREILERLSDLVASLPGLIEGISLNILIPLREEWVSDQKDEGLRGWFIEPLTSRLLKPIEALMDGITDLSTSWDRDLDKPIKESIKQRAALRQQIAEYRARHGLQEPAAWSDTGQALGKRQGRRTISG